MRRLLLALLVALAPGPGRATTIAPRSLADLTAEADQVVQGRVSSARAVREGGLIFTEYVVDVAEWLKPGPAGRPRTIALRQPGGTVGDLTMHVEGAAHFAAGEDVLLFTKDYGGQGHQQVANLAQGALRLQPPEPGESGSAARRRVRNGASAFAGGAPEDLDEIKARVRALVAERP